MLLHNTSVLWRELDGEAVLLNPKEGCSYHLNTIGTLIWKMLDGEHTPDDIASAMCELYDVEHAQALGDVKELLHELREYKLVSDSITSSHTSI
jgi:coenzyme PQQ synthesis protein D (PqqD)